MKVAGLSAGSTGPLTADQKQWKAEFEAAQHSGVATVKASADKWSAGITGLIGAFAAVSVVVEPLGTSSLTLPWVRWGVFILATIAGLLGVIALSRASIASAGKLKDEPKQGWEGFQLDSIEIAGEGVRRLRQSRMFTLGAVIAIVLAAVLSQLDNLTAPTQPATYLLTNSSTTICGPLIVVDGTARVNGIEITKDDVLTAVTHC